MCVLYKPSLWKVPHEYSTGAGGGNDLPKVTQLLDSRPGTQTPFSALATSLSVSFPFRIQCGNDPNSLSSRLVTVRTGQNPGGVEEEGRGGQPPPSLFLRSWSPGSPPWFP